MKSEAMWLWAMHNKGCSCSWNQNSNTVIYEKCCSYLSNSIFICRNGKGKMARFPINRAFLWTFLRVKTADAIGDISHMLIFVNNPTWVMLQRVESDFTRIPKVKVVALHYIFFSALCPYKRHFRNPINFSLSRHQQLT